MSPRLSRAVTTALSLATAALAACSSAIDQPTPALPPSSVTSYALIPARPEILISQVYGGGGNAGATYKNDFIELFNPGTSAVTINGWSVQYASSTGTTWQVTNISGSIPAGGYYLVQEAVGSGGTTGLPTPEATGTTALSATAGKIWLSRTTTALSGACPTGGSVVDQVGFGTAASNCGAATTATLSNTTAALRKDSGCMFTADNSADFSVVAPSPRNGSSATHACPVSQPVGPLDHVAIAGPATVVAGGTTQLTGTPQDANGATVTTATLSWTSSDASVATVDATGKVTGVATSQTPVTITVTATDNGIIKTNAQQITVSEPGITWIDVSSSSTSFPPGFQTQLFFTARASSGGTIIPATFTVEALDPSSATIRAVSNTGIVTGVSGSATKPRFRITATPNAGGTPYPFTTSPLTIETPAPASSSIYATNDEFGDPSPASTSNPDDQLIVRSQYTLSYNQSRGTPNWVSYELDARQMMAGQDRCNCFTADPNLPESKQILTSDYTNGGYDRGHMTRSADRTAGNVDNAITFYLTNVVPQQADLNQGVWAQFENALADSARNGRAVYVVTGPLYSRSHGLTFIKNEGKVAIPDSTWKIAVIGPDPSGVPFTRSNVQTESDLANVTVLAVNMPNVAGVRNNPWSQYLTTVTRIQDATGLDFLSLLSEAVECRIEVRNCVPDPKLVSATGSTTVTTGTSLVVNSSATDADGADGPWRLNIDWGDATSFASTLYALPTSAKPFARAKAWSAPGTYTVRLTVTDKKGAQGVSTLVVTVTP